MARKRNKAKSLILHYQRLSLEALYEGIDRARAGNDARAGIDMAKECYRRDPSPVHADLLSDQYLRRARQLMEKSLATEAMTVLGHALLLGPGNTELLRLAFECGLRSGKYETATQVFRRLTDEAEKARALVLLADEAIAKGDAVLRLADAPLREDATRIRRAFAAYEQGDDSAVSAELQPIGLRSPCAAWKWLLLGLVARSRDDTIAVRKCWSRADGEGAAGRLARALLAGIEDSAPKGPSAGTPLPAPWEGLDNPRLSRLVQIKAALDHGHQEAALSHCRSLITTIDTSDRRAYALRLGRAVCGAIDVQPESGDRLRRLFGALPEDPWYTRAAALCLEESDVAEAMYGWSLYLRGLRSNSEIPVPLHKRARALIWRHMGELAERIEFHGPFGSFRGGEYGAVACYRKSISYFPDCLPTQARLLDALQSDGETRAAEDQAERILARWPTHVPSLLFAAKGCAERNAFRKALNYLHRAREAEPFNGSIRRRTISCVLYSARRRLDQGKIALAREDFEQAALLCDASDDVVPLYCQWAALEWRAGRAERAEELFHRAQESGTDPLLVHYQVAIEVSRVGAPAEVRGRFDNELAALWRGRPSAANAAAVAELTMAHVLTGAAYEGSVAQRRAVRDYLKRAQRLTDFTEAQLMSVCRFLLADGDHRLAARYGEKGAAQYAENYHFPLVLAKAERCRNPRKLTRKTRYRLQKAMERAVQARDFKTVSEIEAVQSFGAMDSDVGMVGLLEAFAEIASCEEDDSFALPAPAGRRSKRASRRGREPDEPMLFADLFDAVPQSGRQESES